MPPRRHPPPPPLPPSLDVVDFAATRSVELRALRSQPPPPAARVYQQLSWHARRRTMSHSSRRVPRRLLVAHKRQLARPDRPAGPRLRARARKLRKRVRFAAALRKLRCRGEGRLETHVWHAKRFAMEEGVALRCNDRGFRSCYRAVRNGCVAHDASYRCLIQVAGERVLEGLRRRLGVEDGRRVGTDPVRGGGRCVRDLVLVEEEGMAVALVEALVWLPGGGQAWLWVAREAKEDVLRLFAQGGDACRAEVVRVPPVVFSLFGPRAGTVLAAVLGGDGGEGFEYIAGVRSPGCLPNGCVYAGETGDPRASFPPKTMGMHTRQVRVLGGEVGNVFRRVRHSALWDVTQREHLHETVASGNTHTSVGADKTPASVRVPFMLLQHGGSADGRGFASGWDLVVPSGWGMTFWLSLMYANGARAFGQEEKRLLRLECGQAVFPEDFADTPAGATLLHTRERNLKALYARRPKGKRVNYTLYGIASPMFPPLHLIAATEHARARATRTLTHPPPPKKVRAAAAVTYSHADSLTTSEVCGQRQGQGRELSAVRILRSRAHVHEVLGSASVYVDPPYVRGPQRAATVATTWAARLPAGCTAFVRVRIRVAGRGVARDLALLCRPTREEREKLGQGKRVHTVRKEEEEEEKGGGDRGRRTIGWVTVGGYSLIGGRGVANGVICAASVWRMVEEQKQEQKQEEEEEEEQQLQQQARQGKAKAKAKAKPGGNVRRGNGEVAVMFRNTSSLEYHAAFVSVVM